MRALEEVVGAPLFTRTQRGVELTRAGEVLQVELRSVVAATEAAIEVARRAASAPEPLLRVAYDETVEWLFLGRVLAALTESSRREDAVWLPRLEEVRPDELLTGHYDAAVTRHFAGANGLSARVLAWERPALYVSRSCQLASETEISLASLRDVEMRVISPDLAPERYRATVSALDAAGVAVTPRGAHNLPAAEVAKGVADGAYVMIGLASAAGRFPDIVTIPLAAPAPPVPVTLVTRSDDQRSAIRDLTETMLNVVSGLDEAETAHWRADPP